MKKLLTIVAIFGIISCHSNSSNNSSADSITDIKPVQNVNGNIPDTTNAADITGSRKPDATKIDSTKTDSAKKSQQSNKK
jgi:hypothetical protein